MVRLVKCRGRVGKIARCRKCKTACTNIESIHKSRVMKAEMWATLLLCMWVSGV